MQKITASDPTAHSSDLQKENIEVLTQLFPELLSDGVVNTDVLKTLVGDQTVTDADERYGLNWHGKRAARKLALTPSTGTLRPCPDESEDWDTTQNLMIEGDNLEVLKLLQKSYAGKVRLIYIDPPYNTGNDFVYEDTFKEGVANYLQITGQKDGESGRVSSNTESSGRFHSNWLNMIYPRLKLARNLLREDGIIMVSCDDKEVANLRAVCDEIYGGENLVSEIIWEGANKNDARQIGICHEYVIAFARNRESLPRKWGINKEGVEPVLREAKRLKALHGDDYAAASSDLAGWFRAMKAKPSFSHRRYHFINERGVYKEENPTAPGGRRFNLIDKRTGNSIRLKENRGWSFDQEGFDQLVKEDRISFITETSIMLRLFLHETDTATPQSVFYQAARSASERLRTLMEDEVFDFPKDETIIKQFVEMATADGDIVMDFFAGSGTTAHSVFLHNAQENTKQKFILVQLPQKLSKSISSQKKAAQFCEDRNLPLNIAELTKERLRLTGAKIKEDNPLFSGDLGFRVFKLDSTNIREWDPNKEDLAESLEESVQHLKTDRSEEDILFELLLKLGLDLCVPIEVRSIGDHEVHSIGVGSLIVCLSKEIPEDDVERLAIGITEWHSEQSPAGDSTAVFRDSAFENESAKSNLTAILEQHNIPTVRSI